MLNQPAPLDLVFKALADPTRREIVERLVRGPASVSDVAEPLDMSLSAVIQHLRVLTESGLVSTAKSGRVRTCQIKPDALRLAEDWIGRQRMDWEHDLDRLGDVLAEPDPLLEEPHD